MMTPTESVELCMIVRRIFPQQRMDDMAPEAWLAVLGDLRFIDCRDAVVAIAKRDKWCDPSEIRAEVRHIRRDRIASATPIEPPAGMGELEYRRWLKTTRQSIADGNPPDREVGNRSMPAIEGAFRSVDDA